MRSLKALIAILRAADATSTTIDEAACEADKLATAAEEAFATAQRAYEDGLLGDEKALTKLDAARQAAAVDLDRIRKLATDLDARLIAATRDETLVRRKAIYDHAVAKCAAIRKRLPGEYRQHALAIRHLLRDLAEAEVARQLAEREAPEFGYIPSPEDEMRGGDNLPEEIVDQRTVELWVIDGRIEPLAAEWQKSVSRHPRDPKKGFSAQGFHCSLRPFVRTRFRAAETQMALDHLYAYVALPGFHRDGEDFVSRSPHRSADTALDELSRDLQPEPCLRPASERPILERFDLRDDDFASAEDASLRSVA